MLQIQNFINNNTQKKEVYNCEKHHQPVINMKLRAHRKAQG